MGLIYLQDRILQDRILQDRIKYAAQFLDLCCDLTQSYSMLSLWEIESNVLSLVVAGS